MLKVVKTDQFLLDIEDIVLFIAEDNINAAADLETRVHQQADSLSDPNFPRRKGRKPGTLELVVHPNYVIVLTQSASTVMVLSLLHVARQYP